MKCHIKKEVSFPHPVYLNCDTFSNDLFAVVLQHKYFINIHVEAIISAGNRPSVTKQESTQSLVGKLEGKRPLG
jgi:hypothetical protein